MKKRSLITLCAVCACVAMTGCKNSKIDANAFDGVMVPVLDRHDIYVDRDPSLTDVERESFKRSSALMRQIVDTAKGS